ncbi:FixH family protein [Planococcus sp. ISL-110]|uniref:FixH family protein n=1 Tax=Planococcus sp. ISL-110 TaxID=2819167 RepID=UPI001BE73478|nr:FixH family protein [Planococcus sp. ISL-110]MBT2571868.1 FixH family protein [Planococcus sp. ISL-110]
MKKFVWLGLPFLLLAACGTGTADSPGAGDPIEEVMVAFNTETQTDPAEEIVLSVTVTQGDEAVEDADEVIYEVWESGDRANSEMIPAEHAKDGVYEAQTSFEEEGLYYMQAHTTARSLHVMPKQEITVGTPDLDSIVPDDSADSQGMDKMEGHSGH